MIKALQDHEANTSTNNKIIIETGYLILSHKDTNSISDLHQLDNII